MSPQQMNGFAAYDGWLADVRVLANAELGQPDPRGGHGAAAHRLLAAIEPPKCSAVLGRDRLRRMPIFDCTLREGHDGEHRHDGFWWYP